MTNLGLLANEVLTTTRAVRKRLDLERPVELSVVKECLEIALQAPSGGNAPRFSFVIVTDEGQRRALADIYRRFFEGYLSAVPEAHKKAGGRDKFMESTLYLAENMHKVPVMVIPCIEPRLPRIAGLPPHSIGASLYPSVWSYMLAARERGLGTCMTNGHLANEQEAAEVLGIPYDDVAQGGLIPTAYTIGTQFHQGPRPPVESFLHFDRWER